MAKKKKERPVEEYNYEKLEKIFERISPNFEKMGKLERKIAAMGTLLAVYKVKDDVYLKLEITEDYVHAWRAKHGVMMGSAYHYFKGKDEYNDKELLDMINILR